MWALAAWAVRYFVLYHVLTTKMIRNIAKAGLPVSVYARDPSKAADIVDDGIAVHSSIEELAKCPIVISIVTDDNALVNAFVW